jgi:hypothetical protein
MNTILIDILGWLSVVLFLVAYSLVSTKKNSRTIQSFIRP